MEFKKYKLGELGGVYSGGTPSTKNNEYWNGCISWITPKDLAGYNGKYISYGERNITKLGLEKSSAVLIPKGSVMMSSRAPIGYIAMAEKELTTNQGFKSIFCDETKCKNEYMYYWLSNNVKIIRDNANGSTFKEISGTEFKNIIVDIPNLAIQNKVIKVLSSIDKKIELNNKINNNLIALGIDNLSNLKCDNYVKLLDMSEMISKGTTPTSNDMKKFEDRSIKFIKIRDFSDYYIMKKELEYIPVEIHKGKLKRSILKKNDLLISIAGTLGKVTYIDEELDNSNTNQAVAFIRLKDVTDLGYLYFYLQTRAVQEEINIKQVHAVQPNFSLGMLGSIEVPILDNSKKKEYNDIFAIIKNNIHQNEILSELRDTLLPKLMNGEIDLDNIEL